MQPERVKRKVVFNLHAHLVFVTKYRKKVFRKESLQNMESIFKDICNNFQVELIEFNGEQDHVHLLIHYPPQLTLSKLVNSLKGVSSRYLRLQFPELEKYYYKGGLWSPSYFVGSVGGAPLKVLKQYIENQYSP